MDLLAAAAEEVEGATHVAPGLIGALTMGLLFFLLLFTFAFRNVGTRHPDTTHRDHHH
jgi:hypothetical protein